MCTDTTMSYAALLPRRAHGCQHSLSLCRTGKALSVMSVRRVLSGGAGAQVQQVDADVGAAAGAARYTQAQRHAHAEVAAPRRAGSGLLLAAPNPARPQKPYR